MRYSLNLTLFQEKRSSNIMASNPSVQVDNTFKLSWSLSELSLYDENTTIDFYINGLPNSEWMVKEIGKDHQIRAIFTP